VVSDPISTALPSSRGERHERESRGQSSESSHHSLATECDLKAAPAKPSKEDTHPIPNVIESSESQECASDLAVDVEESRNEVEASVSKPERVSPISSFRPEMTEGVHGNVSFLTWTRLPNGCGVQGCTVVPYLGLVKKLIESAPSVYWLQSPPSSGKTALGNILQKRNWKYVEADFFDQSAIHELTPQDKFCFIDEAHQLDKKSLFLLRRLAGKGSIIVCASDAQVPSPYCPDCEQRSCKVCMNCWSYACSSDKCCNKKHLVDASYLNVADSLLHRMNAEALCVTKYELEYYLQLFLHHDRHYAADESLKMAMAKSLASVLWDYCGGLMCHVVTVMQQVFADGIRVDLASFRLWMQTRWRLYSHFPRCSLRKRWVNRFEPRPWCAR